MTLGIFIAAIIFIGITLYITMDEHKSQKIQFIFNTYISIFLPLSLFFIFYFWAFRISEERSYSASSSNFLQKPDAFDWENTWWAWLLCLILIAVIEIRLFLFRKKLHYFSNTIFRTLFYLSTISTVSASIIFFMTLTIQTYGGIKISTKDGFLLYTFFICYILPLIFWVIYYVVLKNYTAFKLNIEKNKQVKISKAKVKRRDQAVKELKEAKELLDLGIISKNEFDDLSKKLKPKILDKEV